MGGRIVAKPPRRVNVRRQSTLSNRLSNHFLDHCSPSLTPRRSSTNTPGTALAMYRGMETSRSAVPSDVPAVQGGVAGQGGVVVLPQWFDPRRAVHEQDIMCLVCGKCFRQLTNTHLRSHDLTTASYKIRFGYNRRRPLMSRALRQMYEARAIQSNLASRIRCRPILSNPELRRQGGRRPIALEEVLARRDAQLRRRDDLQAATAGRPGQRGWSEAAILERIEADAQYG